MQPAVPARSSASNAIRRSLIRVPRVTPLPLRPLREPFDDPDWLFELKYDGFLGRSDHRTPDTGPYATTRTHTPNGRAREELFRQNEKRRCRTKASNRIPESGLVGRCECRCRVVLTHWSTPAPACHQRRYSRNRRRLNI